MHALRNAEMSAIANLRINYRTLNQVGEGAYQIPLNINASSVVTIEVQFPARFPIDPPRVSLVRPMSHPMVSTSDNQTIYYAQLRSWSSSISLTDIVVGIHKEFISEPPTEYSSASESMPDFNQYLKPGDRMDDEEDIVDFLYSNIPEIISLEERRTSLLQSNKARVDELLRRKEEFQRLEDQQRQERETVQKLTDEIKELMGQVDNIKRQHSSEGVLLAFRNLEENVNRQAEEIKQTFLAGDMSTDEFIGNFVPLQAKSRYMAILQGK